MARIALYVTEEELEAIKEQAGDVPLSKWCRKRLLHAEDGGVSGLPRGEEVSAVKRRKPATVRVEGGVSEGGSAGGGKSGALTDAEIDKAAGDAWKRREHKPVEPCKNGAYPGLCRHAECNR